LLLQKKLSDEDDQDFLYNLERIYNWYLKNKVSKINKQSHQVKKINYYKLNKNCSNIIILNYKSEQRNTTCK
jgi:hypothetical protein